MGSGSLAAALVNALSQSQVRMRVAVIGRLIAKTSQLVKIANARAAMFGAATRFEGAEIRKFQAAAFANAFRALKPWLVFQTASLQSPWEAVEGENEWTKLVAAAGFGITLPLQMALTAEVSRGAEDSNAEVVNASCPDCVNVALARLKLPITCGMGNAAIVEAFCRGGGPWKRRGTGGGPPRALWRLGARKAFGEEAACLGNRREVHARDTA